MPKLPTIRQRLASFGFNEEHTGGGCTAYIRRSGEVEECLTIAGDPAIPTRLRDEITLGTHAGEEYKEEDYETGWTLADVLAALEHPSGEYVLLTLRLSNGFYKSGAK